MYISYPELPWGYTFIVQNVWFEALTGTIKLWFRNKLSNEGTTNPKYFNPVEVVGCFCLETLLAVHYYARTDSKSGPGDIEGFFPYLLAVDHDGMVTIANIFAVDVDLKTRKMIKAKFDDDVVPASHTLIIIFFI